jgi:choice-of-anchor B domain-containing protein
VRRSPVSFLLALSGLAGACGGDPPTGPVPLPTPGAGPSVVPSLNMTLLAQVPVASLIATPVPTYEGAYTPPGGVRVAGNWGYTSPDGRRFALTGTAAGLSILEVTDPARPRNIGLVPGFFSGWREVRTYGPYAYVSTEARAGLDIIDLSDPDRPRKVRSWDRTFSSAHTLWIDEERGLLFANGTRSATGADTGLRILDVGRDPEDPREVGSFTGFYIHDSYTRGDVLYASAISSGFLSLLDVRDPGNVREVTRFFTGGRFTHNSWLSRDGRYLFTTDERADRPMEVWDLRDAFRPEKVAQYIARPGTIPHNVLVDGDRLLIAHYTEGVHMLDVRDPTRPAVMGHYDTFPGPSDGFAGAWGAYIFPGSDLILVSDIQGGLFVIRSALR